MPVRYPPDRVPQQGITYEYGRLHAATPTRLQARPAGGRWPEARCRPSTRYVIAPAASFPALNHEAEHAVTATTALVPVRARRAPVAFSTLQNLMHALQARHDLLAEGREDDVCAGTLDLHGLGDRGRGWREEVVDVLVVNFEV